MRLKGKVAIVTGGARGMGHAHCIELAREGADIVTCSRSKPDKTVEDVKALGRRCIGMSVDVSNAKQVKEMVDRTAEEFGKIDILVNNAGIAKRLPTHEITENQWDEMMAVNLKGPWLACKYVIPHMIRQKSGRIVNIASIAGLRGYANQAHYTASKHGLIGLTTALAVELAPHKVTVNAICPGATNTSMLEECAKDDGLTIQDFIDGVIPIPLGRILDPREISNAVVYFASEAAENITGQSLVMDGGILLI